VTVETEAYELGGTRYSSGGCGMGIGAVCVILILVIGGSWGSDGFRECDGGGG
jgi:hypothetical protein